MVAVEAAATTETVVALKSSTSAKMWETCETNKRENEGNWKKGNKWEQFFLAIKCDSKLNYNNYKYKMMIRRHAMFE